MNLDRIGKYRVVGKIGQGAMGEVYKAHDPLLNRFVALKTISPSLAADSEFRRRFQREAQSAAQLNHPNIVTVFDFGEESGLTYMAMELLEGRDLRETLRSGALSHLGRRLEVMEELCEGLAFAHAHGVVHRDLKPGNIHIQPGGRVKILDFGLARLGASEMTRSGTVMGTPHYMSPEQVRGQKADPRSDVFSLGAIFYEILSGHRAFDVASTHEVLQHILEREPTPLRRVAPDTPAPLVVVIERALAKSPESRFADAGEMGRALERARDSLAGETLEAQAEESERTLLAAAGETIVDSKEAPRGRPTVAGANALDLRHSGHPPRRHEATVRPDPTVLAGPATQVPGASPWLIGGTALVVLVALGSGFLWLRGRSVAQAPGAIAAPGTEGALSEALVLSEVLVTGKVELARADLAGHDYASAAGHAREALDRDPANPEARDVLERAERAGRELDSAVAQARQAVAHGDTTGATGALDRVLALDPRHPLAAELSSALNRHFRGRAEEARREATRARAGAEAARSTSQAEYAQGRALVAQAEGLFRREEFAVSAQKFFEARSAFDGARRSAAVAAASPPPVPVRPSPPAPSPLTDLARATDTRAVAPAVPTAPAALTPPAAASIPLPSPSATAALPTPSPSATVPAPTGRDARTVELVRVIEEYKRAIEARDVALVRVVKPNLSAAEEKGLSSVFKDTKTYHVEMSIDTDSVRVEGDRATLRVSRLDTVNGRPLKPLRQTFSLERQGGAWRIVSYAFER